MAAPKSVLRLLDANLNRAREGLRVVEDTARFVWNDAGSYKRLRLLRHRLQKLTASRYKLLVSGRDSENDSGRRLKEGSRSSIGSVASANLRRAQEAVRVLEEYSKVFSPGAAGGFKRIRYRLYVEEKKLWPHL